MLNRYLYRLYDTIISRGYVEIERLDFDELPGHQGIIMLVLPLSLHKFLISMMFFVK